MGQAALKLELEENPRGDVRRAGDRADVFIGVDVTSEHNFWTGLTMNMSEGGIFVATHHHVPVGTRVTVSMCLPFERDPITVLAEVRWTRGYSGQDEVPPGIGLQFVDLDDRAHAKIRQFVATIREPLFYDD